MLKKLLVANRGEIAIRALRAASELGIRTASMYAHEDRGSAHRLKADESYEVGVPGHPVGAYLDVDGTVDLAVRIGADAVYPGYGFMSENPKLARRCAEAGIVFVGPPAEVLAVAGNKVLARDAATGASVPVLRASTIIEDARTAAASAADIGYPLFVKAAAGGGGRGMRFVESPEQLEQAVDEAIREAGAAFGDSSVYLEQALVRPRHIEVQILADASGGTVHLFERDCSIQRRHQKVIELAPAPNLAPALRDRLCADAVKFARAIGYVNAGTVEFLVDTRTDQYVFIEMNPRIQVEHTITEETTDVDLVRAQLLIGAGATLAELNISQASIRQRGFAIQCRITTEDPAHEFRPDSGRITAYRAPGGAGIRVDEGSAYVGAEVSPYYDSLLLKVTARGDDFGAAIARARRAVSEIRVRGVSTNQAFLTAVLDDPDFRAGRTYTTFVDERPQLSLVGAGSDRASRLLTRLAEVTVNRPYGEPPSQGDPREKLPPAIGALPPGTRDRLTELGPLGFANWLREQPSLQLTDTTFRDAHQSLLATRMRTFDMLAAAPAVAGQLSQLFSLEVWGGATFDVALRFLSEDPWDRLAALRERVPNICLQMLLRGSNLLGYERYPERAVRAFVAEAHSTGIDIFRIFDALNNIEPMRPAIEAAVECGAVAEGTICYTGNLIDPSERLYTLDYYLRVAEGLVGAGAHILAIKDMAGLLRPEAARLLVSCLRETFDLPVHLHTHDTGGGQLATYLAAAQVGVDAVDGAAAPLAGGTSQPALSAIVAAVEGSARASNVSLAALLELEPYWEHVRDIYAPFESGLRAPTGRVYQHEIPGGQLSNLHQQAIAVGLGGRFEEVEAAYVRANKLLGDIIKVTPTSKVVGDLALFVVSGGIDWDELEASPDRFDLPDSVLGYLNGDLGIPPGGLPQPFAVRATSGKAQRLTGAGERTWDWTLASDLSRRDALAQMMFPEPFDAYRQSLERYGDVSVIPTRSFLYGLTTGREEQIELERGVRLVVELDAIGSANAHGRRTVLLRLNGQMRTVETHDASAAAIQSTVMRAEPSDRTHIAAPLAGLVNLMIRAGDAVSAGQPIAVLEAMKMESTITAPFAGQITNAAVIDSQHLEPGDLIVILTPDE